MTKKADKAAEVAANKFAAYAKKAQTLAGWTASTFKMDGEYIRNAYEAGLTAEVFAVQYACKSAVGAAVWPLKLAAVQAAGKAAQDRINEMVDTLTKANWQLDEVAPRPSFRDRSYQADIARRVHQQYEIVFNVRYGFSGKALAQRNSEREVKYVADAEARAAYQYDLFVLKLVAKIGPDAVSAFLIGDHVWSYSLLTVDMKDGSVQHWKTQQIINTSKHGLCFPRWPSRKMKH